MIKEDRLKAFQAFAVQNPKQAQELLRTAFRLLEEFDWRPYDLLLSAAEDMRGEKFVLFVTAVDLVYELARCTSTMPTAEFFDWQTFLRYYIKS